MESEYGDGGERRAWSCGSGGPARGGRGEGDGRRATAVSAVLGARAAQGGRSDREQGPAASRDRRPGARPGRPERHRVAGAGELPGGGGAAAAVPRAGATCRGGPAADVSLIFFPRQAPSAPAPAARSLPASRGGASRPVR